MNDEDNLSRVQSHRQAPKPKKKKHIVRNVFLGILVVLIILTGVFATTAFHNLKSTTNKMYQGSGTSDSRNASSLLAQKKPVSILILGTDTGALGRSYKGRTDTMMVMTLNPQKHKTTLVSIPRDMEVNFPDYPQYSPAKINSAYTYGGVKEAIKTVENHFNIPIDYYVLINMGGLEKAINDVGGITVTSPLTFSYGGSSFTKGQPEHMDGKTALNFARMRHQDPMGDYGRQERQRLVITALMKKSISPSTVLNKDFLDSISSQVKTDLTLSDMKKLAFSYRGASKNVESTYAQGSNQSLDGIDFQVVSVQERQHISDIIRKSLGLKPSTIQTE